MRFLIISHVRHKEDGQCIGAYGPYVREMNLWLKHVGQVRVIAPISEDAFEAIDLPYEHPRLEFIRVPSFDLTSPMSALKAFIVLPRILLRIFQGMRWAEHIHLRCPGNMGLLGCLVQIFFPKKPKTAKYAGNWDPRAKQPWSYRFQQKLLRNIGLTRNMQALVYGEWSKQIRNIRPFFTATYHETEKVPLEPRSLGGVLRLVFVGGLTPGKQPLLAVRVTRRLIEQGVRVSLEILGEGVERGKLEQYIGKHKLQQQVCLRGNVDADTVKAKLQKAHFLIFISKSEGWPKVVAEAMFWGCVPITRPVSCVPDMLGQGSRGALIEPTVDAAAGAVNRYLENPGCYSRHSEAALNWARQFTLESFETAIVEVLKREGEA